MNQQRPKTTQSKDNTTNPSMTFQNFSKILILASNISIDVSKSIYKTSRKQRTDHLQPNSYVFKSQDQPLPRMVPKNILFDKEQLYEDNLKLKQEINSLNYLVHKQQIDYQNQEKVLRKYEVEQKDSVQAIVSTLKQQTRKQQQEIKEKDDEIKKLKTNSKETKRQEMESEIYELTQEVQRLMSVIKTLKSQELIEHEILNTSSMSKIPKDIVKKYKEDNIILSSTVAQLEADNIKLKEQIQYQELEKERVQHKLNMTQKQVNELNKKIQFLRQDMYPSSMNQKKQALQDENQSLKQNLDQKISENLLLNSKVKEHERNIAELERKIRDMEHDANIIKNIEMKEREKLNEKIFQLTKENERLQIELQGEDDQESDQNSNNNDAFNYQEPRQHKSSNINKKKVQKVNFYDIQNIAHELKLKLVLKNFEYEKIPDQLFSQINQYDQDISIQQIITSLKAEPFCISDNEQATLLARYLVEDNDEEMVIYDPNNVQDIQIVNSISKKVIPAYVLISPQEREQLEEQFSNMFNKYSISLIQAIKMYSNKKNVGANQCEKQDFESSLEFCDIILNQRQKEFFEIESYSINQNIEIIPYQDIFDKYDIIFKIQKEKERKMIEQQKKEQEEYEQEQKKQEEVKRQKQEEEENKKQKQQDKEIVENKEIGESEEIVEKREENEDGEYLKEQNELNEENNQNEDNGQQVDQENEKNEE